MNLIILDSDDPRPVLTRSDPRAAHVLEVLRRSPGDDFDIGLTDGRIGKAILEDVTVSGLRLSVSLTGVCPDLHPITVIIGMPRPQTARRLLRDLTALGVRRLVFCDTEKSEPGYRHSKLWSSREFERHLIAGAEQAFNPRLPVLTIADDLGQALDLVDDVGDADRLCMDNYESPAALSSWKPGGDSVVIALGAERGWSPAERDLLRSRQYAFHHLGERVLRIDTAAVACVSVILSRMGLI